MNTPPPPQKGRTTEKRKRMEALVRKQTTPSPQKGRTTERRRMENMIKNQIPDQDFRKIETETEAVKYHFLFILIK